MKPQGKKIIVLAYSRKSFDTFLYENRAEGNQRFVFGDSPESMHGIEAERVIIYSTFWDRSDANELYKFANSRVVK